MGESKLIHGLFSNGSENLEKDYYMFPQNLVLRHRCKITFYNYAPITSNPTIPNYLIMTLANDGT